VSHRPEQRAAEDKDKQEPDQPQQPSVSDDCRKIVGKFLLRLGEELPNHRLYFYHRSFRLKNRVPEQRDHQKGKRDEIEQQIESKPHRQEQTIVVENIAAGILEDDPGKHEPLS
jgi:hypothetical protein